MNFKEEIKNYNFKNTPYIIKMGLNDIAIIVKENNPKETSTKIIAKYVSNETESSFLININENLEENFNNILLNIINTQKIKLLINLTVNNKDDGFDIEINSSKNLSAIFPTIKILKEALKENHIQSIYNKNYQDSLDYKNIDIIKVQLNKAHINEKTLENLSNALIKFITEYLKH